MGSLLWSPWTSVARDTLRGWAHKGAYAFCKFLSFKGYLWLDCGVSVPLSRLRGFSLPGCQNRSDLVLLQPTLVSSSLNHLFCSSHCIKEWESVLITDFPAHSVSSFHQVWDSGKKQRNLIQNPFSFFFIFYWLPEYIISKNYFIIKQEFIEDYYV